MADRDGIKVEEDGSITVTNSGGGWVGAWLLLPEISIYPKPDPWFDVKVTKNEQGEITGISVTKLR